MLESMTGFGRAERTDQSATVLVEVRSVNGRYLKVHVHLPEELVGREAEIEQMVRSRLGRGTVSVRIHLKRLGAVAWRLNREVVESYARELSELQRRLGLEGPLRVEWLAALPGSVEPGESTEADETLWGLVVGALEEALNDLLRMRRAEGQALARTLLNHLDQLDRVVEAIAQRAPQVLADWRERLRRRLREMLADSGIALTEADLARETVLFAERADITEEINRLRSHLQQFRLRLQEGTAGGRTLDFLTQEMLREANTIAAKANDAVIAQQVVRLKGELDRVREQVQNVA